MAKRRRIGIIYQYNENWIGGTYYIQNLILALKRQPEKLLPELIILCDSNENYTDLVQLSNYPFIKRKSLNRERTIFERIVNKIYRNFFKINIIPAVNYNLDIVFPGSAENLFKKRQVFLYWIPDFQDRYLSNFFTDEELKERKKWHLNIVAIGKYIVFSSEDAQMDFNKFYPENKLQQFVLHFAVTHDFDLDKMNYEKLVKKYNLPAKYFICSNQFWAHKNHSVVLNSIALLKRKGVEVFVVFTGKEYDYRSPEYFGSLKQAINALNIEDRVCFLGFISREDQLLMMKMATAVIQPSLFEGWSTVIEDAKALNCFVIASDIGANKEQLVNYPGKALFDPESSQQLANCLQHYEKNAQIKYYYDEDVKRYGQDFLSIIDQLVIK